MSQAQDSLLYSLLPFIVLADNILSKQIMQNAKCIICLRAMEAEIIWIKLLFSNKCASFFTFSPRFGMAGWIKFRKDPYSSQPGIWDHPSHIWLCVDVSHRMESPLNQSQKPLLRVDTTFQHFESTCSWPGWASGTKFDVIKCFKDKL